MRIFATRNYRLSMLPLGARLFYSLFLVMVFLGLLTCLGFIFAKSGTTTAAVAEYYRQEELGLGGKPLLELIETAHFHLFSMPMFFLVLGHIFFLSSWSDRAKMLVVLASFVSLLFEVALPFLIVFHSAEWAWCKHLSRTGVFVTFLVFIAVPLYEMWAPRSEDPEERRSRRSRRGRGRTTASRERPAATADEAAPR